MNAAGQLSMFLQRGLRAQKAVNDICRNRHGGDRESRAANRMVRKRETQERILAVMGGVGLGSMWTLDEMAMHFNVAPNRISGRFSELKAAGLIEPTGERRETRTGALAKVYRLVRRSNLR